MVRRSFHTPVDQRRLRDADDWSPDALPADRGIVMAATWTKRVMGVSLLMVPCLCLRYMKMLPRNIAHCAFIHSFIHKFNSSAHLRSSVHDNQRYLFVVRVTLNFVIDTIIQGKER